MRKMIPRSAALAVSLSMLPVAAFSAAGQAHEAPATVSSRDPADTSGAAPPPGLQGADSPIARYAGGTVTRGEYERWLRFIHREADPERLGQRVASIALHKVWADRARALGMEAEPDVRMAVRDFENRLLHERLRQHLAASLPLSEAEIDAAVEARRAAFVRPRRVRLYNILRRYPAGSDDAAVAAVRERAEAIRSRIAAGEAFKAVARVESESQTRFRDGLIGWVRPGQLAPEVEKIALALEPGAMSPVLATADGFTLLWCAEVDAAYRPPIEEIRAKVAKSLRRERFDTQWQRVLDASEAVSFDLSAARGDRADALVAKLPSGDRLSAGDVAALLRVRGVARSAADLSDDRLESTLRNAVELAVAAARARAIEPRPLDQSTVVREQLHWQAMTALSTAWLKRTLAEHFVPLEPEEIRAYYDAHRHQYLRPAQTHLEVIMLTADRETLRQRFRQVEDLVAAIRAARISFAEAARRHSEHRSASTGGEAGWLDRSQIASMGPNVLKTVEALGTGEMSGLVQQPEGLTGVSHLWIVRKSARRPSKLLSFGEAGKAAENRLGNERTRALEAEIRQEEIVRINLRPAEAPE